MKIIQLLEGPATTAGSPPITIPEYVIALTDDGRIWLLKRNLGTDPNNVFMGQPDHWLQSDLSGLPFREQP